MGERLLIATVGESCAPLVRSVKDNHPDYAIFICSRGRKGSSVRVDGPDNPCTVFNGEALPSIVAQTGLRADQYEKVEIEADDVDTLEKCLDASIKAYEQALTRDADAKITADYTGGTKTMSAALVRIATGQYALVSDLSVVTGDRNNLRTVHNGTESAVRRDATGPALNDKWLTALHFFNNYYYASADALLTELKQHQLTSVLLDRTRKLTTLARGFDRWDRFDHSGAYDLLQSQGAIVGAHLSDLRVLTQAHDSPDGWNAAQMLPIYDLLCNAERRAAQGRCDDAVARLYRALELLEQNRLRACHRVDTSKVDLTLLPEVSQTRLMKGRDISATDDKLRTPPIQIALREGYAVLTDLNDAVGHTFQRHEKNLTTMLQQRNSSILAHGTQPINADSYRALYQSVEDFVAACAEATALRIKPLSQFPALELRGQDLAIQPQPRT